jgi:hypothetical protein
MRSNDDEAEAGNSGLLCKQTQRIPDQGTPDRFHREFSPEPLPGPLEMSMRGARSRPAWAVLEA